MAITKADMENFAAAFGPAIKDALTLTPQRIRLESLRAALELRTGVSDPADIITHSTQFERYITDGATGDGPKGGKRSS